MALKCELLDNCGFLSKYHPIEEMACRWSIQEYCRGTKIAECKRWQYRNNCGAMPPDDMMPSGKSVRK